MFENSNRTVSRASACRLEQDLAITAIVCLPDGKGKSPGCTKTGTPTSTVHPGSTGPRGTPVSSGPSGLAWDIDHHGEPSSYQRHRSRGTEGDQKGSFCQTSSASSCLLFGSATTPDGMGIDRFNTGQAWAVRFLR